MKREDLKNDVKIIGELINKEVRRNNEGKDDETISLDLTVETGATEQHVVSFFAYKYGKDKDGKRSTKNSISKLFSGYETVVKEFHAVSDNKEGEDRHGEYVEITGSLTKNKYVDKSEQFKEFTKIKGTFCSRVKDMNKYKPCAVWSAHIHITGVEEEVKDSSGEYTKVKGIIVDYVEDEFEFKIYHPKVIAGFGKIYDKGDSALFKGNIVNRPDEAIADVEEDEDDCFGVEMEVEADNNSTIRRRYLEILKGDSKPMDTDDEDHPLSEENIKQYRKNMAKRKNDIIAKHEEKQKQENKGDRIDPTVGVIDDEDIIPF